MSKIERIRKEESKEGRKGGKKLNTRTIYIAPKSTHESQMAHYCPRARTGPKLLSSAVNTVHSVSYCYETRHSAHTLRRMGNE